MNEDFGVGINKRRRATSYDVVAPRPMRIDVRKYRPASEIAADRTNQPQATAITMDEPAWDKVSFAEFEDTSGNDYSSKNDSDTSDDGGKPSGDTPSGDNQPGNEPKTPWYKRLVAFFKGLSRKQWLIIAAVVLLLAGGAAAYFLTRPDAVAPAKTSKRAVVPPKPAPIVSPLTGMEVSAEDSKRPIISVMIENSTFARPQSGLQQAGVVYEAIAEYGITRFLTVFQEANPENVGPVRSARPYYVDWARSYDAAYGHVGGSPDALQRIKDIGVRDLDQFANAGAYRRTSDRDAPHNVYTTMQQLRELTAAKDWASSSFTGWARKKEAPAKTITAQAVDINISGPTYNVHYDYDKASNSYLRTMGGEAHNDAGSGQRIMPKVVIGLATQYSLMADGYHSQYATTGSGTMKVFQDGTVTEGTWERAGNEQYKFYDASGKPLALNPGQTWVTVVGDPAAVTYTAPAPATPAATPAP